MLPETGKVTEPDVEEFGVVLLSGFRHVSAGRSIKFPPPSGDLVLNQGRLLCSHTHPGKGRFLGSFSGVTGGLRGAVLLNPISQTARLLFVGLGQTLDDPALDSAPVEGNLHLDPSLDRAPGPVLVPEISMVPLASSNSLAISVVNPETPEHGLLVPDGALDPAGSSSPMSRFAAPEISMSKTHLVRLNTRPSARVS